MPLCAPLRLLSEGAQLDTWLDTCTCGSWFLIGRGGVFGLESASLRLFLREPNPHIHCRAPSIKFLAVFLSPGWWVSEWVPTPYMVGMHLTRTSQAIGFPKTSSRVWSHALRSAPLATPRVSRAVQLHERRQPEGSARTQSRRNSQAFMVRFCRKELWFWIICCYTFPVNLSTFVTA